MFGLFKASPGFVFLVDTAGNVSAEASAQLVGGAQGWVGGGASKMHAGDWSAPTPAASYWLWRWDIRSAGIRVG